MNQHIKELAEQAYAFAYQECKKNDRPGGVGDHIWVTLAMGKLTELVIEECAEFARQHNLKRADRSYMIHEAIKDYFKVEK